MGLLVGSNSGGGLAYLQLSLLDVRHWVDGLDPSLARRR